MRQKKYSIQGAGPFSRQAFRQSVFPCVSTSPLKRGGAAKQPGCVPTLLSCLLLLVACSPSVPNLPAQKSTRSILQSSQSVPLLLPAEANTVKLKVSPSPQTQTSSESLMEKIKAILDCHLQQKCPTVNPGNIDNSGTTGNNSINGNKNIVNDNGGVVNVINIYINGEPVPVPTPTPSPEPTN